MPARNFTRSMHGGTNTVEFYLWKNIIQRCTNPKNPDFPNYGGRGIGISTEWLADFAVFRADVGIRPAPHMTLERINNDGHYCKGNVVWATRVAQAANRRPRTDLGELNTSAKLTTDQVRCMRGLYDHHDYGLCELARLYGVSKTSIGRIVRRESWRHMP